MSRERVEVTLFLMLIGCLFLIAIILRLIIEGVTKVFKDIHFYWPVLVAVVLVYLFITSAVNDVQVEVAEPTPVPQEVCRIWSEPIIIHGHLLHLEKCKKANHERYRLYFGNEVLAEERYTNGVIVAQGINTELLLRLKKQKPKEKIKGLAISEHNSKLWI